MKLFTRPEFELVEKTSNKKSGIFKVEPLERGFGVTLGNALRRTLLSATPGSAVFAIKIRGAAHEFTSIEGIVENVSRIILNLKQLVLNVNDELFPNEEYAELKLLSTTAGAVTAKDIQLPAGVEVLNPELHIATLADGGVLDMIMYAKKSRGYKSFKDNKKEKNLPADVLTIDSNYSPIIKVNYEVEPTKIGKNIDLEKLEISIDTDGSVSAADALATAARVLISHLEFFVNLNSEIGQLSIIGANENEDDKELDESVDDLDFTQRSLNCLKRAGILTLRDLVTRTEDEIQEIRNLGKKSFKEIKDKVAQLGLTFKLG